MTYRQPAFMTNNLISGITDPLTALVTRSGPALIASSQRAFVDGRAGSVGFHGSTGSFAGVTIDLGGTLSVAPNRAVIPEGQNYDSYNLGIVNADNPGLTSSTQPSSYNLVSGAGVIDRSLSAYTDRYWGWLLAQNTSGLTFTHGGYWLGNYEQLSSSAAVQPQFDNGYVSQLIETEFPSGIASVELAAPRRKFSLDVRDIDPASSDYSVLADVMLTRGRSFWYWPPDTTDAGPYLVRLSRDASRRQEFAAPSIGLRYRMSFEFVEDKL